MALRVLVGLTNQDRGSSMTGKLSNHVVYWGSGRASLDRRFYLQDRGSDLNIPWVLQVHAVSPKQALWYVYNSIVEHESPGGIHHVDHELGIDMCERWPFNFQIEAVANNWEL